MSLFAVFVIVAMVANVVIRDDETGFAPILRSTRVGKWDYLVGRFSGVSLAVGAGVLAVGAGIMFYLDNSSPKVKPIVEPTPGPPPAP